MTQTLLDSPGADRPGSQPRCALCHARPETPFGLCLPCLRAAAAELARITPRPPELDDGRPASVPFTALCTRCGRPGHDPRACDA
jgi:hypothetical protein